MTFNIGQDDATPASNLLDSNNSQYHATADKLVAQNHKIAVDQKRNNGYTENVSMIENVKVAKLQQESHTFNVNVNTDLSEYDDPLKEKVKVITPKKHEVTSVNNQDLKTQSQYIDHYHDINMTNGKGITETSNSIISNGINGLNCNGYSDYKSVYTPGLVSQKAVISNHTTIDNGLTAIQKYYIDSN